MTMSRRTLLTSAAVAAGTTAVTGGTALAQEPVPGPEALRGALDYAVSKVRVTGPAITTFPEITRAERWTYVADGGWVGGFWPGTLWMAYLASDDAQFKTLALAASERLSPRKDVARDHDMGFLFYPSWVTAWRLTGDVKWRDGAIKAADGLIGRFNAAGRFIRAWGSLSSPNDAGRSIIDTMMNLDLLAFASKETGDRKYLDIAIAHAKTTQTHFVRPDGSTPHVFDFNPTTGAPIGQNTVQGYSPTSAWSRGQAWAIYGFTTMYRRTNDASFLATARKLSDFALGQLTPDHVPVWDYRAPQAPNDIKDSSAGAIMAAGLLDLAKASGRSQYRDSALRILHGLTRDCLTKKSTRAEAVLARGTRNRPSEDGVEVSLPYADYYFMEALLRVLKPAEISRAIGL
ncbi:glycoside hydrolase family 88 protein [Umezawaea endophytica]|uniref:Glycoside hydrolase family 88 protein n=2 Tax=Umezawaea endophytica TaxID=1654476 RepID=A0A9X2VWL2_9PSEU|nr:glycoside hydrolase family 88 protein [Umezawaea endophytica]